MNYLNKSFSSRASTKAYRDGWEKTFGKKKLHRWSDLKVQGRSPERIAELEREALVESEELQKESQ